MLKLKDSELRISPNHCRRDVTWVSVGGEEKKIDSVKGNVIVYEYRNIV